MFVFFDAIPLGDLEIDSNLTDSLTGEVVELGSSALVGVVLHAGPDGVGLDDDVYWILTNPIRDTYGVSLLPGLWRYSAQPGIVSNLAALCTWAQWLPPPPTPRQVEGEEGSRTWRRSLNRSSVRKALLRGAVTGVNVVDLGALHTTGSSPPPEQTSSSRSVRAHWRRGYWNSVRVATRDADGNIVGDRLGEIGTDWHYEGRWIHSVLVQGTSSNVVTVYAVPE